MPEMDMMEPALEGVGDGLLTGPPLAPRKPVPDVTGGDTEYAGGGWSGPGRRSVAVTTGGVIEMVGGDLLLAIRAAEKGLLLAGMLLEGADGLLLSDDVDLRVNLSLTEPKIDLRILDRWSPEYPDVGEVGEDESKMKGMV